MSPKKPARERDPFDASWKVLPTTRTLRFLAIDGWTADPVDRWLPGAFVTKDYLGIADIIAVRPGCILAIQATADTAGSNAAKRMVKCSASPNLRKWIEAGGQFAVWTWSIRKAKGEKSRVTLRRWTAVFRPTGLDWVAHEERSS